MNTYTITSSAGQTMGIYAGETPAHALAAMHRDAGYQSVRVEDGELVFPDADTEALCGGLDVWTVTPVDLAAVAATICAEPCGECGGRLVPTDLADRTRTLRGRTARYPVGLLIPVCTGCGAITTDAVIADAIEAGMTPVVSYEITVTAPSPLGEHLGERILFSTRERAEEELPRLAAALEIDADDLHVTERAEAPHAGF